VGNPINVPYRVVGVEPAGVPRAAQLALEGPKGAARAGQLVLEGPKGALAKGAAAKAAGGFGEAAGGAASLAGKVGRLGKAGLRFGLKKAIPVVAAADMIYRAPDYRDKELAPILQANMEGKLGTFGTGWELLKSGTRFFGGFEHDKTQEWADQDATKPLPAFGGPVPRGAKVPALVARPAEPAEVVPPIVAATVPAAANPQDQIKAKLKEAATKMAAVFKASAGVFDAGKLFAGLPKGGLFASLPAHPGVAEAMGELDEAEKDRVQKELKASIKERLDSLVEAAKALRNREPRTEQQKLMKHQRESRTPRAVTMPTLKDLEKQRETELAGVKTVSTPDVGPPSLEYFSMLAKRQAINERFDHQRDAIKRAEAARIRGKHEVAGFTTFSSAERGQPFQPYVDPKTGKPLRFAVPLRADAGNQFWRGGPEVQARGAKGNVTLGPGYRVFDPKTMWYKGQAEPNSGFAHPNFVPTEAQAARINRAHARNAAKKTRLRERQARLHPTRSDIVGTIGAKGGAAAADALHLGDAGKKLLGYVGAAALGGLAKGAAGAATGALSAFVHQDEKGMPGAAPIHRRLSAKEKAALRRRRPRDPDTPYEEPQEPFQSQSFGILDFAHQIQTNALSSPGKGDKNTSDIAAQLKGYDGGADKGLKVVITNPKDIGGPARAR
jgi:hypothetical protein